MMNSTKLSYTTFTNAGKRKNYESTYSMNLTYDKNTFILEPYPKFVGIVFVP